MWRRGKARATATCAAVALACSSRRQVRGDGHGGGGMRVEKGVHGVVCVVLGSMMHVPCACARACAHTPGEAAESVVVP